LPLRLYASTPYGSVATRFGVALLRFAPFRGDWLSLRSLPSLRASLYLRWSRGKKKQSNSKDSAATTKQSAEQPQRQRSNLDRCAATLSVNEVNFERERSELKKLRNNPVFCYIKVTFVTAI